MPAEHSNFDLNTIITPVNVKVLDQLLRESNYDPEERKFLVNGFRRGFDLEYIGPWDRKDSANNIPFQVGVGNKFEMWQKIMKEVEVKRYTGPYDQIPFQNYIQSPIGLVPKAGNKTRLIYHLSFDFGKEDAQKSVNFHTPQDLCTVKYPDIEHVVRTSLKWIEVLNGL